LDATFKIKDLGPIHYFLGIEVLPTAGGLILTQRKFVKELLLEFGDPQATPVICPLDIATKLHVNEGEPFSNPNLYRKIIGKLNFLTNTRPDLAFAVQHLSQFMQEPRVPHYHAVQHVLRYLQRYPALGFFLTVALTSPCLPTVIQTGPHALTLANLSVAMLCFWEEASFPGSPRSRVPLPSLPLKQNTGASGV